MRKSFIHAAAGTIAVLTILIFWTSTLVSELFLSHDAVLLVKQTIVKYGFAVLAIAMIFTGVSGNFFGKNRKGKLIEGKKKRMVILFANALFIMVPSAVFLNMKAAQGEFDSIFYFIQMLD